MGECAGRTVETVYVGDGEDGGVFFGEAGFVDDLGDAGYDARGVEVVVEGLALAEEFGEEEEVELSDSTGGVADVEAAAVSYGYGGFYHHDGVGIDAEHEVDHVLYAVGVEEVLDGVVVCRGGDDHEVGVAVGLGSVERGCEVKLLFGEIFLDILVLYGRAAGIDEVDFLGNYVDGCHMVVLGEECGYAETNVAGSGHGYFILLVHCRCGVCRCVMHDMEVREWGVDIRCD